MARWRPAEKPADSAMQERRSRLRSLFESLESRRMLSVAALTVDPAAVTSSSFAAGNLLVPQFDSTGGKTLLKAEVQYKVDLASVLAATGTNPTTDPATLQGDLNVFANLTVPGASAGNPAGATNNPQGVTLVASPSVPLPPGSVDVPISYDSETAQPGVGHIDKTLVMTGAQAGAAGYVGAGTNPFARVAGGTATLSIAGGPTGTIVGGWTTTVNFSADPLYYYYVPASISGIKFNDADNGADKDAGEAGLPGWTINISGTAEDIVDAQLNVLVAGGAVNTSVVTGAGGAYSFTNLGPGTYTISEVQQAGWNQTFPAALTYTVTIAADGTASVGSLVNNDFGNFQPPPPGNEGLTPGFWKQNATFRSKTTGRLGEAWIDAGYSPNQTLESVFDVPNSLGIDNRTLLQALGTGGGGVNALMRAAVAAVLNAAHPDIDYPLTLSTIITDVNAALAGGNKNTIENLKNLLDGLNNSGGGVDQHGNPI